MKLHSYEKIPENLQKEINLILRKYSSPPSLCTSLFYLGLSSFYTCLCSLLVYLIYPFIYSYLFFILYSICMGTILMGFWVLGHECGHGAFAPTELQNDVIGFILHSALLVPYFSWKYSHNKHHKFTNHLTHGETHVPKIKMELHMKKKIHDFFGEDIFSILNVIIHLIFGWPSYLFAYKTGGRLQADFKTKIDKKKWKDHFHSGSQVMKSDLSWKIELSTLGCLSTIILLYYYIGWASLYWYGGPYLVINAWLVCYTWLHHTHPDIPHYGSETFSFLKGALTTIDRPYHPLINHLHHEIGSTHVVHHLNYRIPHYRAREATKEISKLLGKYYHYDDSSIYSALLRVGNECHYVNDVKGTQYFKKM